MNKKKHELIHQLNSIRFIFNILYLKGFKKLDFDLKLDCSLIKYVI